MRTRLLTLGAAALIAFSAVAALEAQRNGGPRPGTPPPPGPDTSMQGAPQAGPPLRGGRAAGPGAFGPGSRLDLTAEQQTAVNSILQKARDEVAPLADELALTRRNLHREVFADKRDQSRINTLASRVTTLEKQLLDVQVKSRTAIADLLTPDQKQVARTDLAFGGGGPGRGPGNGPGMGRGMRRGLNGPVRPGRGPGGPGPGGQPPQGQTGAGA